MSQTTSLAESVAEVHRIDGRLSPLASHASASHIHMPGATSNRLPLQGGDLFGPITLAYETWGTLNAAGDNAILLTHPITCSAHAHDDDRADDPKAGWWNRLIGPGRPFDTSRYLVICSNVLGSCYGSNRGPLQGLVRVVCLHRCFSSTFEHAFGICPGT